jgi:hypothetical protein
MASQNCCGWNEPALLPQANDTLVLMTRRELLALPGAALSLSAYEITQKKSNHVVELRSYFLRTNQTGQSARVNAFLSGALFPALKKAGAVGTTSFAGFLAPGTPSLLTAVSFSSVGAWEAAMESLNGDKEYQTALEKFHTQPGLSYERMETSLLRCFDGAPQLELSQPAAGKPARLFELRTYESNDTSTLRRKIRMFNEGEIAVFRKTGLQPVFFGETIIGPKMPNLTYMLVYDDFAARDKNWAAFLAHPEWAALKAKPGYADAEIVSNISAGFYRPQAYSQVR